MENICIESTDTVRNPQRDTQMSTIESRSALSTCSTSTAAINNNAAAVLPGSVLPGWTDDRDIAAVVLSADGRIARRQRNRERVVAAYVGLLRDGVANPSATDVAERADLTSRTVYRYLREDLTLKSDVAQRILAPLDSLDSLASVTPINDVGQATLSNRIEAFVSFRLDLYDLTAPIMSSVGGDRALDPFVAAAMDAAHAMISEHLASVFASELDQLPQEERHADLIALHTLLLFESLEYLHEHVGVTRVKAVLCRRVYAALAAVQVPALAPSA